MRPAKRLRLRFSSLLLLLWAAPRPCAAGDGEDEEEDAGLPGHKDHHWSYKDMPEWASMFPNCEGHLQSPININTAAVSFSAKLEPLLLSGYDLPPEERLPLRNNGHTESQHLFRIMVTKSGHNIPSMVLPILPSILEGPQNSGVQPPQFKASLILV